MTWSWRIFDPVQDIKDVYKALTGDWDTIRKDIDDVYNAIVNFLHEAWDFVVKIESGITWFISTAFEYTIFFVLIGVEFAVALTFLTIHWLITHHKQVVSTAEKLLPLIMMA